MIARAIRQKIAWSTFVQFAGKILQIVLGIVAVKVATQAMGVAEYGVYGKIAEYALFFSVIANLGIFGNTVRQMALSPKDGKLFVNALVLRIATALIFFLAGASAAWILVPDQAFLMGVLFFMASLLFDYVTSVCDAMLQANYTMGRAVFALVMGRLANLGVIVLLSQTGATEAPLFFLAPLAASLVAMSFSLLFVRLQMPFVWKLDRELMKMLLLTSLPFGIINIVNNLYYRFLPSLFAAKALNDAQFGSYNISLHMATTASLFSTFLMFSVLPAFKQSLEEGHVRRSKELYTKLQWIMGALGALTILGGAVLGPFAVQLVSSADFILPEIWFVPLLLFILTAVSFFYDLVLITLFALEEDLWFLKAEVLALVVGSALLLSSVLPVDPATRILLVLMGAIAGESCIVLLGTWKIRKSLPRLQKI